MGCESVDCIHLTLDTEQWWTSVNTVIKGGEFLNYFALWSYLISESYKMIPFKQKKRVKIQKKLRDIQWIAYRPDFM
jgi:hypothetical protein